MKKTSQISLLTLLFAACAAIAPAAHAQLLSGTISVDFNSTNNGNNSVPNAAAGSAAVIAPGTWNELTVGASGGPIALNLATGVASNVSMTYTAGGSYDVYHYMSTTETANSPNLGLLRDYLYSNTTAHTVTLSGLSPDTAYDLYLYSGGNSPGRKTTFTIGSTTEIATFADADKTFVSGDNYVPFLDMTSSGTGTLTISFAAAAGGSEGDFDGFQLTPTVPEPSTWVAGILMAGVVGCCRLRARNAA